MPKLPMEPAMAAPAAAAELLEDVGSVVVDAGLVMKAVELEVLDGVGVVAGVVAGVVEVTVVSVVDDGAAVVELSAALVALVALELEPPA